MRYPGGKGRCYQHIVSMMPPHRVYIETHLGGGAVLRHKRPAAVSIGIDIDPAVIFAWLPDAPPGLELRCGDAAEVLRTHPFRGDELVYCDPPYLRETRRCRRPLYRYDYTTADHLALIAILRDLPCAVLVSGYRSRIYDVGLCDWTAIDFPGDSHAGPRTETVWRNFAVPSALHDYAHVGATYRDRERIKRKRAGLARRIGSLSRIEREALFLELAEAHPAEFKLASSPRP